MWVKYCLYRMMAGEEDVAPEVIFKNFFRCLTFLILVSPSSDGEGVALYSQLVVLQSCSCESATNSVTSPSAPPSL